MKSIQTQYTFDASAKTIECADFSAVGLNRVLMVVNATRGAVIYNPANAATKGTLAGDVLTLTFDTTAHADADVLQIFTEDGVRVSSEETLQSLSITMQEILSRLGYPDNAGAMRVNMQSGTITSISSISTLTTLSRLTSIGTSLTDGDMYLRTLMASAYQNSLECANFQVS